MLSVLPVVPGEIVGSKYRVDRVIGQGGMGIVVAATRFEDGVTVAIKLLRPSLAEDRDSVGRFTRESQAASRIASPHIARVFDVGELEDGTPYIVMEFLDGEDLAHVLEVETTVGVAQAVDWLLEAGEAIAEAHAHGIVHRDLKPSNLFCACDAAGATSIKVLDFGISKILLDASGVTTTQTASMLGSPLYMSPEQLKSAKNVDARSDIWALGIILYELVNGTPPFMASTIAELGAMVLSGDAPRLEAGVPAGLADVVATCLRRDPAERFVNLADLAEALAPFGTAAARASAQEITRTLGLPTERARVVVRTGNDVGPSVLDSAREPTRSRWLPALALAGVVGALVVVVMERPRPAPIAPPRVVDSVPVVATLAPEPEPVTEPVPTVTPSARATPPVLRPPPKKTAPSASTVVITSAALPPPPPSSDIARSAKE